MSLQKIPINKIRVVENHRVNINSTHLDELMQSIKQHGLMQPIGVAPDGKRGYILRFGHRRLIACTKLGYATIEAMVSGPLKEEKFLLENLTENMQRKDPSFAELGRIINKLAKDLNTAEIAVRLGIPAVKISQIVKVYEALPEKYRKRIVFMEKGGGRKARKGCVPADVATKIVRLKKEHGLTNKSIDSLFKAVGNEGLDKLDIQNVGLLINSGMAAEEALRNMRNYGVFTFDVVFQHQHVSGMMEKYGLVSRQHLFRKIMYGELPHLPKPSFISTGPLGAVAVKKKKADVKSFVNMRKDLMKLAKSGKLTEEQKAALSPTGKIPAAQWTDIQCEQIKSMFVETK